VLQTLLRVNSYTQVAPGEPARLMCCANQAGESPDTGRHLPQITNPTEGLKSLSGPVACRQ
jgi:hypothetical protein